jgi:acyl carrier protein
LSEASVTDVVLQVILEVAKQQRPELSTTRLEHSLTRDLGLDSLDFAQIVAELEIRLGTDPFRREAASGIVTVGDLVSIYERVAGAAR